MRVRNANTETGCILLTPVAGKTISVAYEICHVTVPRGVQSAGIVNAAKRLGHITHRLGLLLLTALPYD